MGEMLGGIGDTVSYVDQQLFKIGATTVTPLSILIFVMTVAAAMVLGGLARRAIHRAFKLRASGEGVSYALERIVQIVATTLGIFIGLQNIGVDLTALAAVGAMLSVGVGFGLQGIAQNLVSGIALLIERPVQRGDFVILGDTVGRVEEISMRATRIVTRDRVAIIVPNHDLLTSRVMNMSRPDRMFRARIRVGVAYGSDAREVERALLDVANGHQSVSREPPPTVFFLDFGEYLLQFELAVWLPDAEAEPWIVSDIRFAIDKMFRERGIQIPFPQREVLLRAASDIPPCPALVRRRSDAPMRLAYVTTHPIQYQAPLFRALGAESGTQLRVFFTWHAGDAPKFDAGFARDIHWDLPLTSGYDWESIPNRSPWDTVERFWGLVNPSLGARLARWRPDVVIVHGYAHAAEIQAIAWCRRAGIPVLLRGESNLLPRRPAWKRAGKRISLGILRRALSGALPIGQLNREYYLHYGFEPERLFFTPYVVDNDFFRSRAEEASNEARTWRVALGIPADATVVGFAAKLSPVKDCKTLIEAFGRAVTRDASLPSKTALVIVGDGPLRAELEHHARSFPSACVRFAGFANQRQMPAAYALADLFVLPSLFEPWGLAINEAMNLARPVVVSDQVGCAPDLVGADNGWRFRAGDVDGLTAVLRSALSAPERLRVMGQASARRIATWGIPEAVQGIVRAAHTLRAAAPLRP